LAQACSHPRLRGAAICVNRDPVAGESPRESSAMPPARRPSPLSDEVCTSSLAPVLLGAPNNVLGATNNGAPLPVKNTFLDVPSGLTPMSLKQREPMMTAPAGLGKKMGCFQAPVPETAPTSGTFGTPVSTTPVATTPLSNTGFHYAVTTPTPSGPSAYTAGVTYTPTPYTPGPFTSAPTTPGSAGATGASVSTSLVAGLQEQIPVWSAQKAAPITVGQKVDKVAWEQVTDEIGEGENDGDSDEDSDDGSENIVPLQLRNPKDAPKAPPGALHPSIGSEGHAMNNCKRCCFFPRGRCANGYECEFCHYEHDKRKRKNKKKRTMRARQCFGNGTTRLLLAKELLRGHQGSRMEPAGSRQILAMPGAMDRRLGAPMASASMGMAQGQLLVQNGAAAFQQQPGGQVVAWLTAAPSQQILGYYQTADASVPRAQFAPAGAQAAPQQQQVSTMYGNMMGGQQLNATQAFGTTAVPAHTLGNACSFGATDSVHVLMQNPQQTASHMIMLPPAMSQAATQGPQTMQPQLYCEPPPPPSQSPRLQRMGFRPPAGAMMPQR